MTTTISNPYLSEKFRILCAEGEAAGEARGEGRTLQMVIEARQGPVSDAIRDQVLARTDLDQLDTDGAAPSSQTRKTTSSAHNLNAIKRQAGARAHQRQPSLTLDGASR